MATPKYPKDMGTEWMNLKREIKDAWTTANVRKIVRTITGGLTVLAGGVVKFIYTNGITGMFFGRHTAGGEDLDGMFIKRPDGSTAFWVFSQSDGGVGGFTSLWDQSGHIIVSDDGNAAQGLARPWIPLTFVNTTELTGPPSSRLVAVTTDTSIVSFFAQMQHPYLHLAGYGYIQTAGATAELKVKDLTSGDTLYTTTFNAGGFVIADFAVADWDFGDDHQIDITLRRSAGTGNVGFTCMTLMGRQSP